MRIGSASSAAVVGGGPAGLMAAEVLASAGVAVTVYDRMPSVGRKLLMAGRGGLNLTHAGSLDDLVARYGTAAGWLGPMVRAFPPDALVAWCEGLGQAVFTGTSGRMFPVAMKASPLLRAWLRRLEGLGVQVRPRHRWNGWDDGALAFDTPDGPVRARPDATVLALGGASWPRLGADGAWAAWLAGVAPLRPSNCGFAVGWSALFRSRFAGRPLKRIAAAFDGETVRGEAMLTETGIEGGAIYALSPWLRDAIGRDGSAVLTLDLRPDTDRAALDSRLGAAGQGESLSNRLRKRAGLSAEAVGLVQEALHSGADGSDLARLVKALPLRLVGVGGIDRAISSAGGLRQDAVDERLMLRDRPGVFAAGEMLDWEAPTGGYLLQGCLSSGVAAARGALEWMRERPGQRPCPHET